MKEIWRDIKGYEGKYQVSNLGNIKSLDYKRTGEEQLIKQCKDRYGYPVVLLYKNGNRKQYSVHRLVAFAFIPNPLNKPQVNHMNRNKSDNNIKNLEWCSNLENMQHAIKTGINKYKRKIIQYDKSMNSIKEWDSIVEASNELNMTRANIIQCCRGKQKSAGGYTWRYKEVSII